MTRKRIDNFFLVDVHQMDLAVLVAQQEFWASVIVSKTSDWIRAVFGTAECPFRGQVSAVEDFGVWEVAANSKFVSVRLAVDRVHYFVIWNN